MITTKTIQLPKSEKNRREVYCVMLGVQNNKSVELLSTDDLESLCIEKGYLMVKE